ncbi:valine--tRNA ligase [Temperatibacter marinus]|uniref:Valine--tRNA ligase n=1 Tax=Temperatibacter marinus TaxID=1456591 RepID=A0AA52H8S8_9PROT|nr:valine--tRNA ligase [Temperatibacter marinus]WND01777.1 valine--tRNA ligase [Temperatibacter marinus]
MALDKTYDPKEIETKWYAHWETSNAFAAGKGAVDGAEPYVIVMPPPNVTGSLHMGHALDNTLQDVLIRFERLRGKDVLWQPGTDHAGIATQMVVERQMDAEGIKRTDLGREKFLERVWEWKAESGGTITSQLRRLGASCDWSREAFTMDEPRSKAVLKKFVQLYKEGLLYKDNRLVNWDPKLKTAISDLEVEQKEVDGHFWHFKYPLEDGSGFIEIATTRPETMLGDSGVCAHPDDARYKDFIGKKVRLPLTDRLIPVVADEHADPEQGTGALKVTPAHDFNDFEIGKRHDLELINVMDQNGAMTNCPEKYKGLDRFDARKQIVADMEALGLLIKVEPHKHMVPYGDRGGVVIEPWLTAQWYVDAETLAKPALEAVKTGATNFIPKNWEKTYFHWMENIQQWCVSRQLWWGHRIPAWYAPDGTVFVEETEELAQAAALEKFGEAVALTRDPDVLDTWFSSAMWPYSTLGWTGDESDTDSETVARYYPNATLVTGFDIIFFWVARMMMSGIHFMGEAPFKNVYIHALVRDEKGAKMSKSKGNVIDPLEFCDKYGADALRFTLTSMEAQGRDIKMSEKRVEGYRNFGTKLWNASRFCEMNGIAGSNSVEAPAATLAVNKWIIGEVAKAAQGLTTALDGFKFNEASDAIYHFTWGTFCDWYVELIKPVFWGEDETLKEETRLVAGWVLDQILVLLHPFMPHITEELWHATKEDRAYDLIHANWPTATAIDVTASEDIDWLTSLISEIRSVKAEANVAPSAEVDLHVLKAGEEAALENKMENYWGFISKLARVKNVSFTDPSDLPKASLRFVVAGQGYGIPLEGLIDLDAERSRLKKSIEKLNKEAGSIRGRLKNAGFVAKAPEHVIEQAKEQLADLDAQIEKTEGALDRLG